QTISQLERMTVLRTIDTTITNSLDLNMTLDVVLEQVIKLMRVDAADVLLLNPTLQSLEIVASRGFWMRGARSGSVRLGEGLPGRVALERKILYVDDLSREKQNGRSTSASDEKFVSYYGVPLIAKGKIKGVLEIFSRGKFAQDKAWTDFLEALGDH